MQGRRSFIGPGSDLEVRDLVMAVEARPGNTTLTVILSGSRSWARARVTAPRALFECAIVKRPLKPFSAWRLPGSILAGASPPVTLSTRTSPNSLPAA